MSEHYPVTAEGYDVFDEIGESIWEVDCILTLSRLWSIRQGVSSSGQRDRCLITRNKQLPSDCVAGGSRDQGA